MNSIHNVSEAICECNKLWTAGKSEICPWKSLHSRKSISLLKGLLSSRMNVVVNNSLFAFTTLLWYQFYACGTFILS